MDEGLLTDKIAEAKMLMGEAIAHLEGELRQGLLADGGAVHEELHRVQHHIVRAVHQGLEGVVK